MLWHYRLGHPISLTVANVLKDLYIPVKSSNVEFCDSCRMGKMHQRNFVSVTHSSKEPIYVIHTDVWGPASVSSIEGYKYYLVMVDEFTRYSWIYPLKLKYDVKVIFSQFLSLTETHVGTRVKVVHCDNGGGL